MGPDWALSRHLSLSLSLWVLTLSPRIAAPRIVRMIAMFLLDLGPAAPETPWAGELVGRPKENARHASKICCKSKFNM